MPGLIEDPLGLDGLGGSSVKKTASPPKEDDTLRQPAITGVDAAQHKELIEELTRKYATTLEHTSALVIQQQADALEAADKQLADWTRRSESCESRLGQLEANETLVDARAHIEQLERGFDKQAKRIAELEAENRRLLTAHNQTQFEGPKEVVGMGTECSKCGASQSELLSSQATIKRMRELGNAVLDTRDAEAKMAMTMENITANFHRGCAKADEQRYLDTLVAASNAEKALHDALSLPADTSTLDAMERDSQCMDWIEDHCTTTGGGDGFELRVWIPVDSECIRGAILTAIAQEKKA